MSGVRLIWGVGRKEGLEGSKDSILQLIRSKTQKSIYGIWFYFNKNSHAWK